MTLEKPLTRCEIFMKSVDFPADTRYGRIYFKNPERESYMKNKKKLFGKTMGLIAALVLCFGMTVLAAPSVTGDTELTVQKDKIVSASYKITNDDSIESVKLTLSYDKSDLTYMSGSGGDNFSGSGGNGLVELSSNPGSKAATFGVKFKGLTDGTSEVTVSSCTITVNGKEIDALSGVSLEEEEEEKTDASAEDEEEEEDDADRATWVIDGRTFLTHHIPGIDGYDDEKIEIQGKQVRVLHNTVTDVYLVYLFSDNGSYRDYFVYNPDTGNIVPYIEKQSGTDTVTFIEPEEGGYVPIRYSYVDMPWGAKYTVPAYKHVIIDGVDEIFDDTNRYLVYGVNQDGEKAWYSYDYDKDSLQLFDDVAYQGEQNYITELEDQDAALRTEADYQQNRYTTDMGRRLMIILVMTLIIIILLNAVVILRMKKMQMLPEKEDDEEEEDHTPKSSSYVTGSLEENESDFHDPEEDELEIIDLDNASDDDED